MNKSVSVYAIPGIKSSGFKSDINLVLEKFCSANEISVFRIRDKGRETKDVAIRQSFCLWASKNTDLSSGEIGKIINRGHATVLHSVKTANNRLATNDLQ